MIPYIPIYKRLPNKFVRYENRKFSCGSRGGIERIAIYEDKHGKIKEEVAKVIWE